MQVGKRIAAVRESDVQRFMTMIEREDDCIKWQRYCMDGGYGLFGLACQVNVLAHRFAYTVWRGPIPDGLDLDHQCHNRDLSCPGGPACPHRRCVDPWVLDPATRGVNLSRSSSMGRTGDSHRNSAKDECDSGHEFTDASTYMWHGERHCRICRARDARNYRRRQKGLPPEAA